MSNPLERMEQDIADGEDAYAEMRAEFDSEVAFCGDGPPGSALRLMAIRRDLNRLHQEYRAVQGLCAWPE